MGDSTLGSRAPLTSQAQWGLESQGEGTLTPSGPSPPAWPPIALTPSHPAASSPVTLGVLRGRLYTP